MEEERESLIQPPNSFKRVSINVPPLVDKPKRTPVPHTKPTFTAGIWIMLFITFLSSICFSIVLPSILTFVLSLGSSVAMVGWAVGVNSVGSFVASPLFGWWADRRTTREVLLATLIIMVIGNVMYSLSLNIWMLLASRFVVGVAAANYAVAQTYLSYATSVENRSKYMALNSAATVLGFIVGPSLALVTIFGSWDWHGIRIDSNTMPGYIAALFSLFGMLILVFLKEIPSSFKKTKAPVTAGSQKGSIAYGSGFYSGGGSIKDVSQLLKLSAERKIPVLPVMICLFAYFGYTASFTVFETIGTHYTKLAFGWGTLMNSVMFVILGVVCVFALFLLQLFLRCVNERVLLIFTTALSTAGFVCIFYPNRDDFVSQWRFWLAVSLCSASYSTSVALLISTYSKLLENLDQGAMMGWLSSAGSLARIVGPVVASYSLEYGGTNGFLVFVLMIASTGLVSIIIAASYRVLTPEVKPSPIGINRT